MVTAAKLRAAPFPVVLVHTQSGSGCWPIFTRNVEPPAGGGIRSQLPHRAQRRRGRQRSPVPLSLACAGSCCGRRRGA